MISHCGQHLLNCETVTICIFWSTIVRYENKQENLKETVKAYVNVKYNCTALLVVK